MTMAETGLPQQRLPRAPPQRPTSHKVPGVQVAIGTDSHRYGYTGGMPSLRLAQAPIIGTKNPLPPAHSTFHAVFTRRSRNRAIALRVPGPTLPRIPAATARDGVLTAVERADATASALWRAGVLSDRGSMHGRKVRNAVSGVGANNKWKTQEFRENFALKEGRVIQDDDYWLSLKMEMQAKSTVRVPLAGPGNELANWKKVVDPWYNNRRVEKRSYYTRRLLKAREEHERVSKKESKMRMQYFAQGKRLLKDMIFLIERKLEAMTVDDDDYMEVATNEANLRRAMDLLRSEHRISQARFTQIKEAHRAMLFDLYREMDDDNSMTLCENEISLLMLRIGQKLSPKELQAAMESMVSGLFVKNCRLSVFTKLTLCLLISQDEDSSGQVDFNEFYTWFSSEKSQHLLMNPTEERGALFSMEIIPHPGCG